MRSLILAAVAVFAVAAFVGLQVNGASAQQYTPTATPTATTTATATATATQTATATSTATATATATATGTASATPVACPTGVTIAVAAPAAGSNSVTVTVTPPQNIKPGTAGDPTSYHLHYFIDTPPTAAGQAVPLGNASIIHSGSLTQDLGSLAPGSHTVYVVLGQLSHVACEARGQVTFNVAAAPTAPKTGTGGLVGGSGSSTAAEAFALLAVTAMLTLGGRLATRRTK